MEIYSNLWLSQKIWKNGWYIENRLHSHIHDFWGGNRSGENLFANCLIVIYMAFSIHSSFRDLPAPPNFF